MPPPNQLQSGETLGRAIFDSKHVKAAGRGLIPPKVFLEKQGVNELSVDRLDYVDFEQAAEVQGNLRGRPCRGWAKLLVEAAAENGRQVHPDPIPPDQLCHAYILLPFAQPIEPEQAFVIQTAHALQLAMQAAWHQAPINSKNDG
ncbi:hypothetical protein [Bradyrhizobium sp. ARR65]|uniref:hypothetical protein n=1 Tax=Bradyrhizobium sp. ARR65 TaxID=1040989 RepID=UPI00046440E6|nr:hypothetical protein [Bradyrhizobium sp. ARR65]